MSNTQNEIRIVDHGSHKKTVAVELIIEDIFFQPTPAKDNPSLAFWKNLIENQEVPLTLTLSDFWVQDVDTKPDFNIGAIEEKYTTRIRLIGKALKVDF